jgi:hypothetical protein
LPAPDDLDLLLTHGNGDVSAGLLAIVRTIEQLPEDVRAALVAKVGVADADMDDATGR